ncbi:hypothetical protein ElyMa_006419200 [Elysia marginata]|uniref:Uncharacterized protein n=1 Tax=Elysia marginata TaxID=1093978 RepID=A0AAV4HVR3_9GAST|nr:hypothetical protein ElyMa_006419200 [Elysia marginata]
MCHSNRPTRRETTASSGRSGYQQSIYYAATISVALYSCLAVYDDDNDDDDDDDDDDEDDDGDDDDDDADDAAADDDDDDDDDDYGFKNDDGALDVNISTIFSINLEPDVI